MILVDHTDNWDVVSQTSEMSFLEVHGDDEVDSLLASLALFLSLFSHSPRHPFDLLAPLLHASVCSAPDLFF